MGKYVHKIMKQLHKESSAIDMVWWLFTLNFSKTTGKFKFLNCRLNTKAAMWILLFKTALKSHVIKSSVVRESIKQRLLTLSTALTGLNPWEENAEISMQKVCWGLFLDQQLQGSEEYRLGRGAELLVTRETLGPRELWSWSSPGQGQ